MKILAIDPGTTKSGYALIEDGRVCVSGVLENNEVLQVLQETIAERVAIEMIASYGMAVGREVFETCVWIGRFVQCWSGGTAELVYRRDVKIHLCGSSKAKDANIRQALLDMFPATGGGKTPQVGTKGQPGPLFGVSSHAWAALAVGVTALATRTSIATPQPQAVLPGVGA